jgi:CBS domain-containing protein
MNVQSIIGGKSPMVATITQTSTLRQAIDQLTERRIGALVVSGDGRAIEGIISERDIVRAAAVSGAGALDGSVGSVMSTDVVTCSAGDGVDRLMALMTERRIRHLPVVDERGHLAGIVSIGDVVKARLSELEQENHALAEYLTGRLVPGTYRHVG